MSNLDCGMPLGVGAEQTFAKVLAATRRRTELGIDSAGAGALQPPRSCYPFRTEP